METIFSKDRNASAEYIAFFDIDQTIANSISGKALAKAAFRKGLLTHRDLANAIFLSLLFRLRLRDPLKIMDDMVSWVRSIPENEMIDLSIEVSREVILPSVYNEAIAELDFHKSNHARIVLLSSALSSVCREIAIHLQIDDIICSDLEVSNGLLTGRPFGHLCYGAEKAVRLQDYCIKNNVSPSEAWYYGDSISDLTALKAVGNPVCVNPDRKLRLEAIKRGWKIFRWGI
jgi:HAD superfamily hydrolase (TIGR01490 family)